MSCIYFKTPYIYIYIYIYYYTDLTNDQQPETQSHEFFPVLLSFYWVER